MVKKLLIAGGSGLIGSALIAGLENFEITILTRNREKTLKLFPGHAVLTWDEANKKASAWIGEFDVVINLAGKNISSKRWSDSVKKEIIESRVTATAQVVSWCLDAKDKAPRILNASAIGIYGNSDAAGSYDETSLLPEPSQDFLVEVGRAWEDALIPAYEAGLSVVTLRFSVVLSTKGGALQKMLFPFKLGLGGPIGSGNQPMSWISIKDVVKIISMILNDSEIKGPINLVSPNVVSQKEFSSALGKALSRPSILPMPSIIVRCLFGEMGETLLLKGQQIKSNVLQNMNYQFEAASLKEALKQLLAKKE